MNKFTDLNAVEEYVLLLSMGYIFKQNDQKLDAKEQKILRRMAEGVDLKSATDNYGQLFDGRRRQSMLHAVCELMTMDEKWLALRFIVDCVLANGAAHVGERNWLKNAVSALGFAQFDLEEVGENIRNHRNPAPLKIASVPEHLRLIFFILAIESIYADGKIDSAEWNLLNSYFSQLDLKTFGKPQRILGLLVLIDSEMSGKGFSKVAQNLKGKILKQLVHDTSEDEIILHLGHLGFFRSLHLNDDNFIENLHSKIALHFKLDFLAISEVESLIEFLQDTKIEPSSETSFKFVQSTFYFCTRLLKNDKTLATWERILFDRILAALDQVEISAQNKERIFRKILDAIAADGKAVLSERLLLADFAKILKIEDQTAREIVQKYSRENMIRIEHVEVLNYKRIREEAKIKLEYYRAIEKSTLRQFATKEVTQSKKAPSKKKKSA